MMKKILYYQTKEGKFINLTDFEGSQKELKKMGFGKIGTVPKVYPELPEDILSEFENYYVFEHEYGFRVIACYTINGNLKIISFDNELVKHD